MNLLVLYYSKTGNTKQLAEAVAEGISQIDGVIPLLKTADEVTKDDFRSCAGIIAGSPVYFGTMAWPLKKVFDEFLGTRKKMESKVGAAFTTSGDPTGGKETTIMSILQAFLIYGMIVVGDPLDATGHYGVACEGAPDDRATDNATRLGRRVADLCLRLAP